MIAMSGTIIIIGALFAGAASLQKSFHASEGYAQNMADQRRLIDYVSRDLRRSIGIGVSNSLSDLTSTKISAEPILIEDETGLVVKLPAYYKTNDPTNEDYDQSLPVIAAGDHVAYGTKDGPAPEYQVSFRRLYLAAEKSVCFVRTEGDIQQVIVRHAENLHLRVGVASTGWNCTLQAWFQSPFSPNRPTISTYDEVMLRNVRID